MVSPPSRHASLGGDQGLPDSPTRRLVLRRRTSQGDPHAQSHHRIGPPGPGGPGHPVPAHLRWAGAVRGATRPTPRTSSQGHLSPGVGSVRRDRPRPGASAGRAAPRPARDPAARVPSLLNQGGQTRTVSPPAFGAPGSGSRARQVGHAPHPLSPSTPLGSAVSQSSSCQEKKVRTRPAAGQRAKRFRPAGAAGERRFERARPQVNGRKGFSWGFRIVKGPG